jgi:hypothetical protein
LDFSSTIPFVFNVIVNHACNRVFHAQSSPDIRALAAQWFLPHPKGRKGCFLLVALRRSCNRGRLRHRGFPFPIRLPGHGLVFRYIKRRAIDSGPCRGTALMEGFMCEGGAREPASIVVRGLRSNCARGSIFAPRLFSAFSRHFFQPPVCPRHSDLRFARCCGRNANLVQTFQFFRIVTPHSFFFTHFYIP